MASTTEGWEQRRSDLQAAVDRHMIRYASGDFLPFFIERAQGSYVYDDSGLSRPRRNRHPENRYQVW